MQNAEKEWPLREEENQGGGCLGDLVKKLFQEEETNQ